MLKKIKSKVRNLSYFYQWSLLVNFDEKNHNQFSKFKKIIPPKDRFWADPFVIQRNGKYFVFFEECLYSKEIGHISVSEVDKMGKFTSPRIIIERDYHLSYPFLFEFKNELYLIHGSTDCSKSFVELFKCENFPYKWKFFTKIIEDIPLVDPTIFYHNQKWWMFACKANVDGTSQSNELLLFFSDNPLSNKWNPHPKNPIISDVKKARPAGKIFENKNSFIRPAQNCYKIYGRGFSFNQIVTLNENEYEEKQLEYFEPDWDKDSIGIHTFNSDGDCTFIDSRIKRKRFN